MDLDRPSTTNNNLNNSAGANNVAGQLTSPAVAQLEQQPSQGNNILIGSNNNNNNNHNMMTASSPTSRSNYDIDVLRIVGQYLTGMGLTQTVNRLLEESGLPYLDHPLATEFQRHIMTGEFDKANSLVEELVNLAIIALQQQSQQQPLISMPQQQQNNITTNSAKSSSLLTEMSGGSYPTSNGHAQTPATSTSINSSGANINFDSIRLKSIHEMKMAITEQKFLELIDDYQHLKALKCLRLELTPLCDNIRYIQQLAALVMCKSNEQVRLRFNWPGKGPRSRQALLEKMQQYVPPPIMLPPRRLCTLLEQAQQLQREHCILHMDQDDVEHQPSIVDSESNELTVPSTMNGCDANGSSGSANINMNDDGDHMEQTNGNCATTSSLAFLATASSSLAAASTNGATRNAMSSSHALPLTTLTATSRGAARHFDLKEDHVCSVDRFPLATRQEIDCHDSEIWYCKFSNDGTRLATAGVGGKVKIWQLDPDQQKLIEKCTLECNNSYSVSCLSWSPNDAYLLACGSEDHPDIWVWNMRKLELHTLINHMAPSNDHVAASYTTCSWHLSGEKFAAASLRGCIAFFDLDGNRIHASRESIRVQCLAFPHKDPDCVLAADALNRLKAYAIEGNDDGDEVCTETNPILSFIIDRDDKYIAVNVFEQGVHLWDFRLKTLVRIFPGVRQRDTTIFSSFSSPGTPFLASGSEDGNVYIYHVRREQPVAILSGHTRSVNCVSWNPKCPELLASVSDDRIIRLWAPFNRLAWMTTTASVISSAQLGQALNPSDSSSLQCIGVINNR